MDRVDEVIERNAWDGQGWRWLLGLMLRPFHRRLDHEHLTTFSDAELADIGLTRRDIDYALRTGRLPK
jgi:hypothetical protein